MSKIKIKKIKIPVGMKDKGISEMFNQMLGAGAINIGVAYPRYKKIRGICEQIVRLFELVAQSPFMRTAIEFAEERAQITAFCQSARAKIETIFRYDLSRYELDLNAAPAEVKKEFSEAYEQIKSADLINTFIVMCDRLVPYKKNFANLDCLNHKFIHAMPGIEWKPFPFTSLNIKYIMCLSGITDGTIGFFMTILGKAYELSLQLYEELQKPCIDVDQFVDFIMSNIDDIKKQPELHRCGDAFSVIKNSVNLLKDNFSVYYRDFIATNDSTIIMQHFLIDVSKSVDASATITKQFKTIIAYYSKMAEKQITDPRLKMLFEKVNGVFAHLERGTVNIVRPDESTAQDDSEIREESPDGAPIAAFSSAPKTAQDIL